MIEFFSENTFILDQPELIKGWIVEVVKAEDYELGEITFVFCEDQYLHKINIDFLKHDTLTDIISFDYSLGKQIHGEIYISTDRVFENAATYETDFTSELHRVMIHGILHYCGYKDKSDVEAARMRAKENESLRRLVLFK